MSYYAQFRTKRKTKDILIINSIFNIRRNGIMKKWEKVTRKQMGIKYLHFTILKLQKLSVFTKFRKIKARTKSLQESADYMRNKYLCLKSLRGLFLQVQFDHKCYQNVNTILGSKSYSLKKAYFKLWLNKYLGAQKAYKLYCFTILQIKKEFIRPYFNALKNYTSKKLLIKNVRKKREFKAQRFSLISLKNHAQHKRNRKLMIEEFSTKLNLYTLKESLESWHRFILLQNAANRKYRFKLIGKVKTAIIIWNIIMRKSKRRNEKIRKMQNSIGSIYARKVLACFKIFLELKNDKKNEIKKAEKIHLEYLKGKSIKAILIHFSLNKDKIKAFHFACKALQISKLKKIINLMYKNALPRISKKKIIVNLFKIKNRMTMKNYFTKFKLEIHILNQIDSKKIQICRFTDNLKKKKFLNKSLLYIKNKKMYSDLISISILNYNRNLLKLSFHGFKLCKLYQIRRDQILLDFLMRKHCEIKNNVFQTLKLISQKKKFLKIQGEILIKKVAQNLQKKMIKCFQKGYSLIIQNKEFHMKANKFYNIFLVLKVFKSLINFTKNKILRRNLEDNIIRNRMNQIRKRCLFKLHQITQIIKNKKKTCKINFGKIKVAHDFNIKKRCLQSFQENHNQFISKVKFCNKTNQQYIFKKFFTRWNVKYQHSKGLKERFNVYIKNKKIKVNKLFITRLKLNLVFSKAIKCIEKASKIVCLKKALLSLKQNSELVEKEMILKERKTKKIIKKIFGIIKSDYLNHQKLKTNLKNILRKYSRKLKHKAFNKLLKYAKASRIKQFIASSQNKVIYKFAKSINNKIPHMLMKRYYWNSLICILSNLKKNKDDNNLAISFYNMKIKVKYMSRYHETFELKRRKMIVNDRANTFLFLHYAHKVLAGLKMAALNKETTKKTLGILANKYRNQLILYYFVKWQNQIFNETSSIKAKMMLKVLNLTYYLNIRQAFIAFKKQLKIKYLGSRLFKIYLLVQNKMLKKKYLNAWFSYIKSVQEIHKELLPSNSPLSMEVTFKKSDNNNISNEPQIIGNDVNEKHIISFSSLNLESVEQQLRNSSNKLRSEIESNVEKPINNKKDKDINDKIKGERIINQEFENRINLNPHIIEHPLQKIPTNFPENTQSIEDNLNNTSEIKFISSKYNQNEEDNKLNNSNQEIEIEKEISDIQIPKEYLNSSWRENDMAEEDNLSHLKSNSCDLKNLNKEENQDSKNSISKLKTNLDLHYFRNEVNIKDPDSLKPNDSKIEQLEESPHFDLSDPLVRYPPVNYPEKSESFDKKDLFGDDYNSKSILSSQKYGSSNQEISVDSSNKKVNYSIEKYQNPRELLTQILREWKKMIKERMLLKQYLKESKIEEKYSVTPLGSSRFDMPKMHFVTPNSCSDVLSPLDIPTPNAMLNFKSPEDKQN